jgi:DNA-binding IclR family transcriptional regulator
VGYRRPLIDSTSGLVLFAFQSESTREDWRARLSPTVSPKAWKAFEEKAATARAQKYVKSDSAVTRHIVDLSAPIMSADSVAAALTCPYIETPMALSIKDTILAIRRTANDISQKVSSD